MSVLWRVGNVDFCMHFGDVVYTCLHSKCGVYTVCTAMCSCLHWQRVISV